MRPLLGILGGMGPLASAEFVKTIYEYNISDPEQTMPPCLLYSEPAIPDRTTAILRGEEEPALLQLTQALAKLRQLDASPIVIPCITAHYFLPQLPLSLRHHIISLLDVALTEIIHCKIPHLLLCTQGTREANIFQRHQQWSQAAEYVILPHEVDQRAIHNLIYQIKQGRLNKTIEDHIDTLLDNYDCSGFIAGCTEIHILTKHLHNSTRNNGSQYQIIDPLMIVAQRLNQLLTEYGGQT